MLKRVCRTIGLARWPYRKRQSLRNVVEQTKLYLNVSGCLHLPQPLSSRADPSLATRSRLVSRSLEERQLVSRQTDSRLEML